MDTKWRLIDSGPGDAFYNMALDEAIATEVRGGSAPPTLRLYGWVRPSVTLGCFQRTSDIDMEYCKEWNIPVVRRPTGGRAILHGDELTYSFCANTDTGPFSSGLLDSYRRIGIAFTEAFRKIGVQVKAKAEKEKGRVLGRSPLCFQSSSYGEILLGGSKLVGSAQKRWTDGLLQQGAIPYHYNREKMRGVFGTGRMHASADYMKALKDCLSGLNEDEFRTAVILSFGEAFGVRLLPSGLSEAEHLLAQELLQRKYLQDHWNFPRQEARRRALLSSR